MRRRASRDGGRSRPARRTSGARRRQVGGRSGPWCGPRRWAGRATPGARERHADGEVPGGNRAGSCREWASPSLPAGRVHPVPLVHWAPYLGRTLVPRRDGGRARSRAKVRRGAPGSRRGRGSRSSELTVSVISSAPVVPCSPGVPPLSCRADRRRRSPVRRTCPGTTCRWPPRIVCGGRGPEAVGGAGGTGARALTAKRGLGGVWSTDATPLRARTRGRDAPPAAPLVVPAPLADHGDGDTRGRLLAVCGAGTDRVCGHRRGETPARYEPKGPRPGSGGPWRRLPEGAHAGIDSPGREPVR